MLTGMSSIGVRWKTWLAELENLIALNITDKKKQRALMLYYAGDGVHQIFRSLVEATSGEDFNDAKK